MTAHQFRQAGAASIVAGSARSQRIRKHGKSNFLGVQWSPSYAAFIVYIFVTTTYRVPIGTEAMAAALIFLPLERRALRLPPPVAWAIAFLAWALVGWGNTAYPQVVWNQIIELAKICGIMLVAVNVLTTRARLRFFMIAFLGFFAFYPIRGALFSYFIYHGDVQGRAAWNYIYSNPNDLAALCLLPLSFSLGLLASERTRWIRYCAIAGAVVIPFVILLTQSRGVFIALIAFAIVILKGQKKGRGKILLLVGASAIVIALAAPSSVWHRLGTLSSVTNAQSAAKADDEGSARQRLEIWRVARTIFAENPITGVGVGAYPDAHYVYSQRAQFDRIALGHRDPHSTYFHLMAETGAVGFLLFFAMVGVTAYDAERTRRRAKFAQPARATQLFYMEVGLFGYFIAAIWGSYDSMVLTYLYLTVLYSAAQILKSELPATRRVGQRRASQVREIGTGARQQVVS